MSKRKPHHDSHRKDKGWKPVALTEPTVQSMGGELLTRDQVATWLKVHPREVERLGIPQFRITRKVLRFLACDVRTWLEGYRKNGGRAA